MLLLLLGAAHFCIFLVMLVMLEPSLFFVLVIVLYGSGSGSQMDHSQSLRLSLVGIHHEYQNAHLPNQGRSLVNRAK